MCLLPIDAHIKVTQKKKLYEKTGRPNMIYLYCNI